VWKEPVRTVARAYGISDVWFAKICRKLSVPLPQSRVQDANSPWADGSSPDTSWARVEILHERWHPRESPPPIRTASDRRLDFSVSKESRGRALRIMNAILRDLKKRGLQVEVTRSLETSRPFILC